MSKAALNSARNGDHKRQKSSSHLDEVTLYSALEKAKELVSIINKVPATIFLWRPEKYWPADFVSDNIKEFGYTAEEFTSGQLLYGNIIYPEDLSRVEKELARKIEEDCTDFTQEYRILTKSGEIRWVEERTFIEVDDTGVVKNLKGIILDITERKCIDKYLYIQRNLGMAFNNSDNLSETLNILLDSCLQIDEIDAGCIVLVDEKTGDLNLAIQRGFSPAFEKYASHFSASSPNTKLVMIGQPVYKQLVDLILTSRDETLRQEKLRATALIPVKSGNRIIAAICLASRRSYELSDSVRTVIETIAIQLGAFIYRINTEEKLNKCIKSKNSK